MAVYLVDSSFGSGKKLTILKNRSTIVGISLTLQEMHPGDKDNGDVQPHHVYVGAGAWEWAEAAESCWVTS